MDWFKWLSSSGLDSSSVHRYGALFTQNQLQADDIPFFNHEFLQSMGITIAKHRLEILKLITPSPSKHKSSSKVLVAAKKTKKSFAKYMSKAFTHKNHDDESQNQDNELVIIHVNDESKSKSKVEYDHQDSRLNKELTVLTKSVQKKNQLVSKSATSTPESNYTYKKHYGDNGTSPIHGNVKRHRRVVSFATTIRPFEEDGLKMADAVNRHDQVHGGYLDDFDLDDGYWSAGVEETKWDNLYHNLKPN